MVNVGSCTLFKKVAEKVMHLLKMLNGKSSLFLSTVLNIFSNCHNNSAS